jgi:hypothetical protein
LQPGDTAHDAVHQGHEADLHADYDEVQSKVGQHLHDIHHRCITETQGWGSEMSITPQGRSIQAMYRDYRDGKLLVNRRYQRKLVWTLDEKS